MTSQLVPYEVTRADFLTALRPLLKLLNLRPEDVSTGPIVLSADEIRVPVIVSNDRTHSYTVGMRIEEATAIQEFEEPVVVTTTRIRG